MRRAVDVVIGTPIYRPGAYIIDIFMSNQREVQREYPSCELVLATNEIDLVSELEQMLDSYGLAGKIILYDTVKPGYAKSKVWNIACGREAIRQYFLSQTEARYYLSIDADMVYDPAVIKIMNTEIQGYDVVFSGYPLRDFGIGLTGAGCMMVNRETLEKARFRCLEFKNGEMMSEDNLFEMDSFRQRRKIKKGVFLRASHYKKENDVEHVEPQPIGMYRKIATSALLRYLLIRGSLIVKYNIPRHLWRIRWRMNKSIGNLIH